MQKTIMAYKSPLKAVIGALIITLPSFAYEKKITSSGTRPYLSLHNLAALNYLARVDEQSYGLILKGEEGSSSTVISGYNHDINANLVGDDDKPALRSNISSQYFEIEGVQLYGYPHIITDDLNISEKDILCLINYIKENADLIIDNDTSYSSTTIGSEDDYKFVYLRNGKLSLGSGFKGYGILFIEDQNPIGEIKLEMTGDAKWYGLILCYQPNYVGSEELTKIKLMGSVQDDINDVGSYVLLAEGYIGLGNHVEIKSGNVGVNATNGSIIMGNNNEFHGSIAGNTIILGNNNEVEGNVYYNNFIHGNNFELKGEEIAPLDLPLVSWPEFPSFQPGNIDITKGNNEVIYLDAGDYRNIILGNNCKLILKGGRYNINKIVMGNNAKIIYQAPAEVRVKKSISFGNHPEIESEDDELSADDLIFYIEGEGMGTGSVVFSAGNNPEFECNIYAPNNTVMTGNNFEIEGAILAKRIISGNHTSAKLTLESAFISSHQKVRIIGAVLLVGREFYLPTLGSNAEILYSKTVLEKVEDEINSRPYRWKSWQEIE